MPIANEMNKAEFDKLQKKLAREKWEIMFAGQLDITCWAYDREFQFHPTRKWRADFVIMDPRGTTWGDYKSWDSILVEIEGGTYSRGRHTRGPGFAKDCEKYNTAAALGWRVFRFPAGMVEDGSAIKFLEEEVFYKE